MNMFIKAKPVFLEGLDREMNITGVFVCELAPQNACARLRTAKQVEREYHFSLLRPVNEVLAGVEETDEVLLQGVVDCFFEEDGALVVVDFKTDRITREQLHERAEQYRPQLEAYAAALERVMERPVREKILCFLHLGEEVAL